MTFLLKWQRFQNFNLKVFACFEKKACQNAVCYQWNHEYWKVFYTYLSCSFRRKTKGQALNLKGMPHNLSLFYVESPVDSKNCKPAAGKGKEKHYFVQCRLVFPTFKLSWEPHVAHLSAIPVFFYQKPLWYKLAENHTKLLVWNTYLNLMAFPHNLVIRVTQKSCVEGNCARLAVLCVLVPLGVVASSHDGMFGIWPHEGQKLIQSALD